MVSALEKGLFQAMEQQWTHLVPKRRCAAKAIDTGPRLPAESMLGTLLVASSFMALGAALRAYEMYGIRKPLARPDARASYRAR